jgi:hypothetical protein
MGRDARLNRALGVDNRGNRARIMVARGQFFNCLLSDLRIEAYWQGWVRARRVWQTSPHRRHLRSLGMSDAAMSAALDQVDIRQLTSVLESMGVTYPWCAEPLVTIYFPTLQHNAEHPHEPRMVKLSIPAPKELLRQGQAPPHEAAEIRRDVEWRYRHFIKAPPDPVHQLTAEYAKQANRVTEAHSVVIKGFERAELLLQATIQPLDSLDTGTKETVQS